MLLSCLDRWKVHTDSSMHTMKAGADYAASNTPVIAVQTRKTTKASIFRVNFSR